MDEQRTDGRTDRGTYSFRQKVTKLFATQVFARCVYFFKFPALSVTEKKTTNQNTATNIALELLS